jgi:hypothetical protein
VVVVAVVVVGGCVDGEALADAVVGWSPGFVVVTVGDLTRVESTEPGVALWSRAQATLIEATSSAIASRRTIDGHSILTGTSSHPTSRNGDDLRGWGHRLRLGRVGQWAEAQVTSYCTDALSASRGATMPLTISM